MKLETQIAGIIGMYYAYYKLSWMSWNVLPTVRNTRDIDIVAYNKEGTGFIGVQVKVLSNRNSVPLGNSLDKIMGDFWILVNNVSKYPNLFVLIPREVNILAHHGEKY